MFHFESKIKYLSFFFSVYMPCVCITDANFVADTTYIKNQCFGNGGNVLKLVAYIRLPKKSVDEYANRNGFEILRLKYRPQQRSFVVTTRHKPLYLDEIEGWNFGYRNL